VERTPSDPAFSCCRRRFLPALVQETLVTLGMMRGGQGGRLSDLSSLSDAELAPLRPVLNRAFSIAIEDDQVWAQDRSTGARTWIVACDDRAALGAFNLFDGEHSLGKIGLSVARQEGWVETRGFALARALFLRLVPALICVPRDPPPLSGQSGG